MYDVRSKRRKREAYHIAVYRAKIRLDGFKLDLFFKVRCKKFKVVSGRKTMKLSAW